jgi:hypothetical protein
MVCSTTFLHAERYAIAEVDSSTPSSMFELSPRLTDTVPFKRSSNRSTQHLMSPLCQLGPTTILRSGEDSGLASPSGISI